MASRRVRVVVRDLTSFNTRTVKSLALNLNQELVPSTPRDTGFAQSNWVPNIGSPFEGTAGTREQAEAGQLDLGPQERGLAAIAAGYVLGPTIHNTNNADYIQKLNAGSSGQAPAAFVQAAIYRAVDKTVREAK